MRKCRRLLGAFVLNNAVLPDWKQWFSRIDRHAAGRSTVEEMKMNSSKATVSLEEANRLVDLFTTHHNFDDLSFVIKYIRESLGQELQPIHYHALMRLFNFSRDKDNFEQMLEVVILRDKDDMDTYARVIDQIHATGTSDALSKMLEVVSLGEDAFGSLRVARSAAGIDHTQDPSARQDAPLLTALAHHCSMMSYDFLVPISVLFWKAAIGAPLVDWDFVNLLNVVLSRAEDYSSLVATVAVFDECPPGHLSFNSLFKRLDERKLLVGENAPLTQVMQAMRKSLEFHRIAPDAVFHFPLVNHGMYAVDGFLRIVLNAAASAHSGNAGAVYHTAVLLLTTLRHNTEAVLVATEAVNLFKKSEQNADEGEAGGSAPSVDFMLTPDFATDIASALDIVSMRTHASFAGPFTDVVKLLESDLNDADLEKCSAIAVTLLETEHQVLDVLAQARELMQQKGHANWATRNLVKHILRWCGRHPPRNCKLSRSALLEREKWAQYMAARDMALALFGSGSQARDAMKSLFYNKLQLATVRDEASIKADLSACAAALDVPLDSALSTPYPTRATIGGTSLVPRHLFDPDMFNPYPHLVLHPMDANEYHQPQTDIFPEVFAEVKNCLDKDWYARDTEVYILLMRCLIHRLDWDACVDLTMKMIKSCQYTALMDQELIGFFWEAGDPLGLLALKIATKIYDGRISVEAKSKREKFQEAM
jgi:hypothetical protein